MIPSPYKDNYDRQAQKFGIFVILLPVLGGVSYSIFKIFTTHYVAGKGISEIVSVSGIDCLLGIQRYASCPALAEGLIYLFVSISIFYFIYVKKHSFLILTSVMFVISGIILINYGNLGKVFLVTGTLILLGSSLLIKNP